MELAELVGRVKELPTLPDVVARVTELVSDPNASAGDINDVLSRDPALASKVLKLANSSFYGFPRRITTITNAVVILGFSTVRNLAISTFVFESFKGSTRMFGRLGFWTHSIGTAVASNVVAHQAGVKQVEDCFIAGLLSDIGKLVLHECAREEFDRVCEVVASRNCLMREAETEVLGCDHAGLGAALLKHWNLPDELVQIVRWHHDPTRAELAPRSCAAVHLGDITTRSLLLGSGGDWRMPRLDDEGWKMLDLSWPDVGTIMDQTVAEVGQATSFFEMA